MTDFHFSASVREGIETILKLAAGTLSVIPVDPNRGERGWDELQAARITVAKPDWDVFAFFTDIKAGRVMISHDSVEKLERRIRFWVGCCEIASLELVGLGNPCEPDPRKRSQTAMWCIKTIGYFNKGRGGVQWGDWTVINCEPEF